jgi:beta-galactosidase
MAGEFIWTGFDYIGEPTPYGWPAKSSYFGAVDTAGFPKDIFYFYQSKWNREGDLMVHIVPMDWTNWNAGQSVPVLVYTNGASVELSLNGKSLGSKTMGGSTAHLQWDVPFEAGSLKAQARRGDATATDEVKTAGAAAKVVLKVDRAQLAADGSDLAFIEADIVDASGVLVPRATQKIDFTVSGPGAIVGVDNGNPISTESYKGTSRAAFSGKALAVVQGTTTAGTITVTAAAGSLAAGTATITTSR